VSKSEINLPVPVLEYPHWRVNIRPNEYQEQLIPSLGKCIEIIEKTKLSLRGWDYPHLSNRQTERAFGRNWVASWANFMWHCEYWRFYQTGQFLHLFAVREATELTWKQKLERDMKAHLSYMGNINWEDVPGFISIINFIYSMTEIFEFAARLCQAEIYLGLVNINVELKDIKGFVLTADGDRAWSNYYSASEENLGHSWSIKSDVLVANSAGYALAAVIWFFERFGWLSPSVEVIRRDQENFLKGRI
jgi:hypothetical protein